jgi:hypothetical protein
MWKWKDANGIWHFMNDDGSPKEQWIIWTPIQTLSNGEKYW